MFGLTMLWAQNATPRYVAVDQDGTLAGLMTLGFAAAFAGWQRRDLLRPPVSSPSTVVRAARAEPASVDAAPPVSAAAPEPARLRFAVFPWGEIRIDGGDPILTPRAAPVELAPGLHRIEIAHPTLGTEVREIALRAGEQRTLHHVFDRTAAR